MMIEKSFSSEEKKKAKNLGSLIGNFTLKRNKPITYKYMNLKNFIADCSQDKSKLEKVIPIVCKILDCAQ